MSKVDKTDRKILSILLSNSRQPLTTIAKNLSTSREIVTYRIKKLQTEGIIIGFSTNINTRRLKFVRAALFLSLRKQKEKEFKQFVRECPFASWSSEFSGKWNLGTDIFGKDEQEIQAHFLEIYNTFSEDIIDHRLKIYDQVTFTPEKILGEKALHRTLRNTKKHNIDSTDKKLLKLLTENARAKTIDLAGEINLSAPATAERIRRLEKAGIIEQYSLHLDTSKMGIYTYSIFIVNKNMQERKKLVAFLNSHPNTTFTAQYIGDPYVEFGIAINDPHQLRSALQEIEEAFPDNRIVETFLVQKDLLSTGPPSCVFK